jgi:hypothetical protein
MLLDSDIDDWMRRGPRECAPKDMTPKPEKALSKSAEPRSSEH